MSTDGTVQPGPALPDTDRIPRPGPRPAARPGDLPPPPVTPGLPRRQHTSVFCASRRTKDYGWSSRRSTAPRA